MSARQTSRRLGKAPYYLEWQSFPSMQVDAHFAARLSAMLEAADVKRRRVARFSLPIGRAVAPCRHRDDECRLGAQFQYLGRFRRSVGSVAPQERHRRVEGGESALDADVDAMNASRSPVAATSSAHSVRAPVTSMDMYDEPNSNASRLAAVRAFPPFAAAWRRCCERLRAELGEDIFNSWFGRLELESLAGGQARLSVPTRFLKSWIDTHYVGHITTALTAAESRPDCAHRRNRAFVCASGRRRRMRHPARMRLHPRRRRTL